MCEAIVRDGGELVRAPRFHFPGDGLFTPLERPTGRPIGHLTSQHFANFLLGAVDRRVTRGLRLPAYVRYMDDLLLFADSKDRLWDCAADLDRFARERLKLVWKWRATRVAPVSEGVPFLGFRLFPGVVRLDGARRRRLLRRLALLRESWTTEPEPCHDEGARAPSLPGRSGLSRVESAVAWSRWGHTRALRRSVFGRVPELGDGGGDDRATTA